MILSFFEKYLSFNKKNTKGAGPQLIMNATPVISDVI